MMSKILQPSGNTWHMSSAHMRDTFDELKKERKGPHPKAQLRDSFLGPAARFLGVGGGSQHSSYLGVHARCFHGLIIILTP